MKAYILLLVACIPFFAQAQKSSSEAHVTDTKNAVPATHAIYRMINDPAHYSLADMDSFYRNDILKEEKAPYGTELKNMGFAMMVDKGLDKADDGLKTYYIEQQLKLDNNIAAIDKFYTLLLSCRTFMPKEELVKNADAFYEKNKAYINKKQWAEPSEKNAKLLSLMKEHKMFNRYITVAMKD